jgi:hypothetical protein
MSIAGDKKVLPEISSIASPCQGLTLRNKRVAITHHPAYVYAV